MHDLFAGLDDAAEVRELVAATVAAEQCKRLVEHGVRDFHFYTMNKPNLTCCHLSDSGRHASGVADGRHHSGDHGGQGIMNRSERIDRTANRTLRGNRVLRPRIDGAMGTSIQNLGLTEADFRAAEHPVRTHPVDLIGNNDLLSLTRPDVIADIHRSLRRRRCRPLQHQHVQLDHDQPGRLRDEHLRTRAQRRGCSASLAPSPTRLSTPATPRWVVGVLGPTSKTASISPDVNDPARRDVTFDQLRDAYTDALDGLVEGGVDVIMIETIFDTLNAKAAIYAVLAVSRRARHRHPV